MSHLKFFGSIVLCVISFAFVKASEVTSYSQTQTFEQEKASRLDAPTASLEVEVGVLKNSLDISVSSISESQLPKLDRGLTNVTDSFSGYRFLPHGEHFGGKGAKVVLGYDRTKIPSGYTEDDIRTYYYDEQLGHWVALQRDSVDRKNRKIISRTTHFTDMINGVIQAPESPETQGFAPTMMSDLQAADPTAKVQMMEAPQANSNGTASLSYSLEMPPARNGMAPNLTIQYSSDAGSGWLGEGWNMVTSAITVDTRWGVPHYNPQFETETYLLDGQMLLEDGVGLAHRELNHRRKSGNGNSGVRFYPRKEGAFSKIVRIGDKPSNYIWEVTDRKGTKYTYGAYKITERKNENNETVKDTTIIGVVKGNYQENGSVVISEWHLTRIQEIHGDYVEYTYREEEESAVGGIKTKAFYLDSIKAGNAGEDPHTVVVVKNGDAKKIKRSDARYGYLTSSNHLLDSVNIYFEGKYLRGYKFNYKEGDFHTNLLASVSHIGADGNVFNTHELDYYSAPTNLFGGEKTYNSTKEFGLLFESLKAGSAFAARSSMINCTDCSDGFTVGGGANAGAFALYGGVSYTYSNSSGSGKIALVDINGDGLPDKVYQTSEGIAYEPAQWGSLSFGGSIPVQNLTGKTLFFSFSKSDSHSLSEDVGAGISYGSIGATFTQTWDNSHTSVYFQDFNNDGLVDIAYKGEVYFNHLVDGVPTFSRFSSLTPNPIKDTEKSMIPNYPGMSAEVNMDLIIDSLEKAFPMHDAVRVWRAPFDGEVSIQSQVSIAPYSVVDDSSQFVDGVRVYLQHGSSNLMVDSLIPANILVTKNLNYSNLSVSKGDLIFFRLQSRRQGWKDDVQWTSDIQYTSPLPIEQDVDGESVRNYNSEADFSAADVSSVVVPANSTVSVTWESALSSSDVRLLIVSSDLQLKNQSVQEEIILSEGQNLPEGSANFSFSDSTLLTFKIVSDNPVHHDAVSWRPIVEVMGADGATDVVRLSPLPKQYNNKVEVYGPTTLSFVDEEGKEVTYVDDNFVSIVLGLTDIERPNMMKVYRYENNQLVDEVLDGARYAVEDLENHAYRFIAYSDTVESGHVDIAFHRTYLLEYQDENEQTISEEQDTVITTIRTSLYTDFPDSLSCLGSLYRGWGQFAYNSGKENEKDPINLADLKMKSMKISEDDQDLLKSWGENEDAEIDPDELSRIVGKTDEMKLFPMSYDVASNTYVGATKFTWVGASAQSASRMGNPVIDTMDFAPSYNFKPSDDPTLTGTCSAPTLSTASFTNSRSASCGVKIKKFGLGASGGSSDTKSHTENSVLDLNGDGYPDWLHCKSDRNQGDDRQSMDVTYTSVDGSLSEQKVYFSNGGLPMQEANAWCVGMNLSYKLSDDSNASEGGGEGSGGITKAIAEIKAAFTLKNQVKMAQEAAKATQPLSTSANGNYSRNDSRSVWEWYDINGDGLPDKVYSDKVRLNLGYSFTPDITFSSGEIYHGETQNGGAGTSITVPLCGSGRICAGRNTTFSYTEVTSQLMDVNGDGLPDKVYLGDNGNSIYAEINMGDSYSNSIQLYQDPEGCSINASKAVAQSKFANGGAVFSAGIFTISPFVSGGTSKSTSRTISGISDVDGDGFLDLMKSNSETELKVHHSRIGATNKLKSVTNPFGGKFTIEYAHTKPTSDHPGGKWAMSALTVSDMTEVNPLMRTLFVYEDGKRDRREREFLGFGKVYTISMDGADTIRTLLQEFDVNNYLTAGALTRSLIAGKDTTVKYREERTNYQHYSVSGNGSLDVDQTASTERLFSAPAEKTSVAYEDGNSLNLSKETYAYLSYGNLGNYHFEDLTNGGFGDYTTTIEYDKDQYATPKHVVVKGSDEEIYREVRASYEDEITPWAITKMEQSLGEGKNAVATFEYNPYGNITKKTLPKNANGEQMFFTYLYDRKYNMYPERVTDAFGYRSEMEDYDYRYGIPRTVRDMNGYTVQYHVDDLGRIDTIIAPNEQSEGVPYTVAYQYVNGADYKTSYAVTSHYDPQHPDDPLLTVTHVDGLGRPYQVKKEAEVIDNSQQAEVKYIVSGRTKYDALGRTVETTHPTTCPLTAYADIVDFNMLTLNTTTYDAIDRPLTQTLPGDESGPESVTRMAYSIEDGRMKSTVTAPNNDVSYSYTNGAGQTSKTERVEPGTNEPVVIEYAFDPIGQLLTVTDAGNNVTSYAYDLAGRRLSVNHPSAGLTSFVYDNAGNVLRKGTANGDTVTYQYEYNRLVKTEYPRHPENNVTYTYGGRNAKHNRVGRLALVEDGSGATEYYYGKMGEVTKQRRTLVIPNVAVATYTTEWAYDSHNRLQEMIYPDGEKVKYFYNLGGQLSSVIGEKKYQYRYIDSIGYDEYEQKKYLKYGNGTVTDYTYSANRRRLSNLDVSSPAYEGKIMAYTYNYDEMDNITSLVNDVTAKQTVATGKTIGGYTSHAYTYDKWNRLVQADGIFDAGGKNAQYHLRMAYDKLYNVTEKQLQLEQENLQFAGKLRTGYEYRYNYKEDDPFRLQSIDTKTYNTETNQADTIRGVNLYDFDKNGNQIMMVMNPVVDSTCLVDTAGNKTRQILWDEENHLLAINDNGFVSNYFYDASGERTVKLSAPDLAIFVNSKKALDADSLPMKFVGYVSPYLVVSNGGRYTKHIYAGTQRIVSKIGDIESFGADPRRVEYAGADIRDIDFGSKYDAQKAALIARYDSFNVDNKPTENNDYIGGTSFCCTGKSLSELSNSNSGKSENAEFEDNVYFYHPDHLGSTCLITNFDGEITQSVAYIPYGEVFVEERNGNWTSPYLFNAKELDEETGLYYYGARYLDPAGVRWLSVDQKFEKYAGISPYSYCLDNPIRLIDPNGEETKISEILINYGIDLPPFAAGVIDGVVNASPVGLVTFGYDIATDEQFRAELCEGIKYLVENPFEALTQIVGDKVDAYSAFFNGTASDEQKYEIGNDVGNLVGAFLTGAGIKTLFSKLKAPSFIVDPKKYDYFFGKVTSSAHNAERSMQNFKSLKRLGIADAKSLNKIFKQALDKGKIIKESTSKYGTTVTRQIQVNKKGALDVSFFYEGGDMTKTPKVITIIPKLTEKLSD